MRKLLCMLIGLVGCYLAGYAQKTISNDRGATIALKTNALYWGTTTPNLYGSQVSPQMDYGG